MRPGPKAGSNQERPQGLPHRLEASMRPGPKAGSNVVSHLSPLPTATGFNEARPEGRE